LAHCLRGRHRLLVPCLGTLRVFCLGFVLPMVWICRLDLLFVLLVVFVHVP
jgi:hypothetical protein